MNGLSAAMSGIATPMPPVARPDDRVQPLPLPDEAPRADFATVMLALFGERPTEGRVTGEGEGTLDAALLARQEEAAAQEAAATDAMQALLAEALRALPPEALPAARTNAVTPPPATGTPASREAASRALDGVAPELRARLERVVDRMQREFGHRVEVMETVRSPERQAWLYAQGRTRPGEVVTWTRDSAHQTGDAVDVRIDGQWRNDRAYGRLHRIAQEEGLRTLGARDPGHLELPAALRSARAAADATAVADAAALPARAADLALARAAAQAAQAARAAEGGSERPVPPGLSVALAASAQGQARGLRAKAAAAGLELPPPPELPGKALGRDGAESMGPGGVAPVAAVADVATVARVAGIAQPAALGGAAPSPRRTSRDDDHTIAATAPRGRGRRHDHEGARESAGPAPSTLAALTTPPPVDGESQAPRLAQGIDRVTSVNAIAARSPRAVAQLTLAIDAGDGRRDEVTVGVRGGQVDTAILTGDQGTADRLRAGVRELREALDTRGLVLDEWRAEARPVTERDAIRALPEREALRLATGADTGALGRDGAGDRARGGDERGAGRQPHDESARDQRAQQQDQRERQAAAREQATRAAAWRQVGRPFFGDDAA